MKVVLVIFFTIKIFILNSQIIEFEYLVTTDTLIDQDYWSFIPKDSTNFHKNLNEFFHLLKDESMSTTRILDSDVDSINQIKKNFISKVSLDNQLKYPSYLNECVEDKLFRVQSMTYSGNFDSLTATNNADLKRLSMIESLILSMNANLYFDRNENRIIIDVYIIEIHEKDSHKRSFCYKNNNYLYYYTDTLMIHQSSVLWAQNLAFSIDEVKHKPWIGGVEYSFLPPLKRIENKSLPLIIFESIQIGNLTPILPNGKPVSIHEFNNHLQDTVEAFDNDGRLITEFIPYYDIDHNHFTLTIQVKYINGHFLAKVIETTLFRKKDSLNYPFVKVQFK